VIYCNKLNISFITNVEKKKCRNVELETGCFDYGVATISRLLKNIGLFCRILSLL